MGNGVGSVYPHFWILIIAVLPHCAICDVCNTGAKTVSCEFGCCKSGEFDKCCEQPFWTWYVIIGIAIGGIIGIMLISLIVFLACHACNGKKKTSVSSIQQPTGSGRNNAVGPSASSSSYPGGHPAPEYPAGKGPSHWSNDIRGQYPPPYEYEPPPKYEDVTKHSKV